MKSWQDCTDEELMSSYAQGEFEAFREIYARHSGKVLGYLKKRLNQPAEAEDLMQTVFLKLHVSRARYESKFPFLTWLFAITRNALIDQFRKKKTQPLEMEKVTRLLDAQADSASAIALSHEHEFQQALKHLPEGQRKALELRFAEGLSFEEISSKTGISEENARKRVSRAMKTVRQWFGTKA